MSEAFRGALEPETALQKNIRLDNALMSKPEWKEDYAFLQSEEIGGQYEFYRPYIPAIKQKFSELFGIEPKVTNSAVQDFEKFLSVHLRLKENPKDEGLLEDSLLVRDRIASWVRIQIIEAREKPNATPEHEEQTERMAMEATKKLDAFYGWIFQNVPLRKKGN